MSAPLVINLKDGSVWERRAVSRAGVALYALAGTCACPEFVMASEPELAELGIAGSADALPMPVGPESLAPRPVSLSEEQIEKLTTAGNRAVNDLVHEDLCACDAWPVKCLSSGGFFQGYWDWGYLETAVRAVLGVWESMRAGDRVTELEAALYTEQAQGRTFLEQRNAHAKELLKLRAERADREDEVSAAVGYTSGLEWSDLVGIVASNTTSLVRAERDVRALRARVAELEAARKQTTAHVEHLAKTLVARTEDLMAADEQRTALAARLRAGQRWQEGRVPPLVSQDLVSQDDLRTIFGIELAPPWETSAAKPAAVCRCGEPGADPYACEADDCKGEFSELNPFGSTRPVDEADAKVSRTCDRCGWRTSVWHVADGSADEELHRHIARVHSGAEAGEPS